MERGYFDEKGLEEKVLEGIAMATGERDTITTGEGCYGDVMGLLLHLGGCAICW